MSQIAKDIVSEQIHTDLPKKPKRQFAMCIVQLLKERQKLILQKRMVQTTTVLKKKKKVLKSSKSLAQLKKP